jgi:hypothetical protein
MAINDVILVSIPVADPQRARSFYVDQLGFELRRDDTSVPGIVLRPVCCSCRMPTNERLACSAGPSLSNLQR